MYLFKEIVFSILKINILSIISIKTNATSITDFIMTNHRMARISRMSHLLPNLRPRTTDAQRGKSLHCTAENSLSLPNFQVRPKHICHIGPIFQISLIQALIGCPQSVPLPTYARHYKPRLVYFFTPFPKTIYVL